MIRTQIYLPEDIYEDLQLIVKTQKVNLSQLIREGARNVIKGREKQAKNDDWKKFVGGAGKSNTKTNAVKDIHDYYANFGK